MEAGRRIPWPANPQIVGELRTMFWHEKAPDASGVVGIGPDSRLERYRRSRGQDARPPASVGSPKRSCASGLAGTTLAKRVRPGMPTRRSAREGKTHARLLPS